MNPITGSAVVSCYMDAASLVVMLVLLILARRIRRLRGSVSMRIFRRLCLGVTANCIFPFIYHAMYLQPAPWCHTAAIIARTLRECTVVGIVVLWLVYVDYKLNGERSRRTLKYKLFFLPFAGLVILLIANLFTGTVFTYSADNQIEPKPLLYIIFLIEFAYFALSAVMVRYYDRKSRKIRFLHISPMIISIVFASGCQLFTPYEFGALGYATGITLLCFSILGEYRMRDEESGLYNSGYLSYLYDLALAGKNDINSALIIEPSGNLRAGFSILKKTLQRDYDVIRAEEKKFLVFSETESRSALQLLSTHIEEAVAKHNAEHPEEKTGMTVHCRMRTGEEDAFTFLHTTAEEKDAGNPMRGVVSMISELERLDNELKLAAEIQLNMLPTGFPPFPDRKEFDLYASMTPAKEVGGDFYDFFLVDSDHLALVIADVSGKGIPAALFMMVSKTLIRNQLMSGCDPAAALERVNLQLCERNSSMMFVTVWTAVLEISTGRGKACNAGHENPGIRRAGGDFTLLKYKHDMFLGVSRKAKYQNREFELHRGDCVFVYTDGVPEATNATDGMFGEARLTETLNRNADAGPEELIRRMREAADRFADGAPQFDDITMLCLKYYGNQAVKEEP